MKYITGKFFTFTLEALPLPLDFLWIRQSDG